METTTFKIELDIAAQSIIHQLMISNEEVANQLKSGIEKAISSFDFEAEVQGLTHHAIKKAIQDSLDYGKLKELIQKRTEVILDNFVEQQIEAYRKKQGL